VEISPQVFEEFRNLKYSNAANRILRYIIFKISDDHTEIQIEHAEADSDWENFSQKLVNALSKSKSVWFTIYITLFSNVLIRD
jgi:cofilin